MESGSPPAPAATCSPPSCTSPVTPGWAPSTAAFGAVGFLVALRLRDHDAPPGRKRWVAPGAGLVLVGLLSAAPRVDITAHALGFAAGLLAGAIGAAAMRTPARAIPQWIAGGVAGTLVAVCWWIARS